MRNITLPNREIEYPLDQTVYNALLVLQENRWEYPGIEIALGNLTVRGQAEDHRYVKKIKGKAFSIDFGRDRSPEDPFASQASIIVIPGAEIFLPKLQAISVPTLGICDDQALLLAEKCRSPEELLAGGYVRYHNLRKKRYPDVVGSTELDNPLWILNDSKTDYGVYLEGRGPSLCIAKVLADFDQWLAQNVLELLHLGLPIEV